MTPDELISQFRDACRVDAAVREKTCRRKMIDLREFRKRNDLTQEQLGEYWGVGKSFISMMEGGRANVPRERLAKLISNPYGWDTSMLTEGVVPIIEGDHTEQNGGKGNIGKIAGDSSAELLALRKENELLRQQLEEVKSQNEKYWAMIERLVTQ